MPTSAPNHRLRTFCRDLLLHEGALVEDIHPHGLEVLLPESTRHRLGVRGDYLRLGFSAEIPAGAERLNLESDWLARFAGILDEGGARASLVAAPDLPAEPRLERVLERQVVLGNAVFRLRDMRPAWTRYHVWVVRYTAVSDENREGLIVVEGNAANRSVVDPRSPRGHDAKSSLLPALLARDIRLVERLPDDAQVPPRWSEKELRRWLAGPVEERIRAASSPFVQGLQRRLDRDMARIHAYYTGLRQESARRMERASADRAREQLRIQAAEREFHGKIADLEQRYALRIATRIVQTIELLTPVWRVELVIKRRKGERDLSLDWNPWTARLDPLPCEWRHDERDLRMVCDDALHLVPESGMAPCASCGKTYCRACSPRRCPSCSARKL